MSEEIRPFVVPPDGSAPGSWERVRPVFHECFQFWPDHEDLIWAKSVWPILADAGFWSDVDDEADAWTQRHILALAILYAESATRFGTPDYRFSERPERRWLTVTFGSTGNLDDTLWEVGRALSDHFQIDHWSKGNAALFLPLMKSFVAGAGVFSDSEDLEGYLKRAWERHPDRCEFQEDALHRMWVGGHFSSDDMECLV